MTVSYSTDGGQSFGNGAVTSAVTTEVSREELYLPATATDVRFQLADISNAYVFLDAVTVSQQPEFESFSPAEGVPGTQVTITGKHLNETSAVFFGTVPVPVENIAVNPEGTVLTTAVPTGASSNFIRVVTPYGEVISATKFVVPDPVFAADVQFSPSAAGAGETITLYGQYFTGVNEVLFNGAAAAPATIEVKSDTEIEVVVPKGATTGSITATSPAGSGVSKDFTVYGPQIIAQAEGETNAGLEFSPTEGPALTTEVTIYGKYFTAVNEVLFNGVKATSFAVSNDSVITATVPLGAGTGLITVKSPAGEAVSTTVFNVPAPQFAAYDGVDSQFKPTSAGPNMQITLYGVNLASVSSVVFLGADGDETDNVEATFAAPISDTELVVTVPVDAKTGKIQLLAPGEKVATSEQTFTFVPAPVIASVANTTAGDDRTYGIVGDQITITGQNFGTAYEVTLGSAILTPTTETNTAGFVVNAEGTAITFNIPYGAESGSVTVSTQGGEATWQGPFDVVYAPIIASFSPTKGPIGQEITITGQYLKYVSEVVFLGDESAVDEVSVTEFVSATDTELKLTVPQGAETGLLSITNPANTTTSTGQFEVVRTPVILSFTPAQGVVGTVVAIEGYNFTKEGELTAVSFASADGTVAAEYTITSDTTLTATVPAGAITGRITVSNANGPGESPSNFTITQKPTITGISPLKGVEGSTVVIEGTEFVGDNITVTFLGEGAVVVATSITVDSPTKITATVPAGAVTGKLMVTNAAGDSEPSAGTYTVVTSPEIISFNPIEGKAGDEVTIKGWLLESVAAVGFNGDVQATPNYNAADSTITVTVPTGATTGYLTLIVGEEVVFTSADVFTVFPAPTIVSFDPIQGEAGTAVTIRGTNFEGLSEVVFNEAKVEDLTGVTISTVEDGGVTYQEFTVAVPDSATTGPITVTADGGTANSGENVFTVPVPANIAFTPTTSYANQQVVITGDYFKNITKVTFNGEEAEVVSKDEEAGTITVKAPFDAGTGPVAVTTLAGTGTSADNYTVIEPIIENLSAEDGTAKGYADRTLLTITGQNFSAYYNEATGAVEHKAPEVVFNGARVTATTYTNESIEVLVPTSARTGNVTVISGSGESEPMYFEVMAPIISAVNPTAVYAGQSVTVTGSNFIDVQSVSYGGIQIPKSNYFVSSETELVFSAPVMTANSSNTLSITSKSGTGTSTLLTVHKPIITSVSRTRVYAGVSTLKISGTRFDEYYNTITRDVQRSAPTVSFAGAAGARVNATIQSTASVYSTTEEGIDEVVVTVPSTATTGRIRVASESGTGEWSQNITIIGAPTITSFSANSGLVGSTFTITGTNFDEATEVTFLGTDAAGDEVALTTGYTINAAGTQITLTVPAGAITGKIAVTTPYNGGTTVTSTDILRVVYAPTITEFTPTSGASGETIKITGTNLWDLFGTGSVPDGAIEVYFNRHDGFDIPSVGVIDLRAAVTAYDQVGGNWVEVKIPDNAISGNITVVNRAGNATSTSEFEVTSPVLVRFEHNNEEQSVISSTSPARINERILLRGYNLEGIGTVKIGSVYATNFYEPGDDTRLEVVVPSGARTSAVSITAAGGDDTSEPLELQIAVPTITATPALLSFKVEAGQSSQQTYTVSARSLAVGETLKFTLTTTDNFLMSMDGSNWSRTLPNLTADDFGNIAETTIHVKNEPGEDANPEQTGTISHSSLDATTRVVTLESEILPLPVELMAFNAALQNNNVLLTWATASEQNNSHFEVEMSREPKKGFEKVGRVDSKGSNSSVRLDYQYAHKLGNETGTIYFRLKQVDLDGTTDYSKVVAVNVKAREVMQQLLVAPNPINYNSKLYFTAEVSGKATLVLHNMTGKKVYTKVVEVQDGPNEVQLPVYDKLSKGMYVLRVELNGQVSQIKVMKE
ncbi:IPT/TIG domain-containing protein [Pontibacter kalidii]|uniref:IPT/TIG domain-containing protein n=1 Tax=Pontibacter kalidii TaxID=2592049 RepID=UPI002257981E|nr:IPT/TIG domain-containing protein [Pontibacter kalidii]